MFPTEDPLSQLRRTLDLENTPLFTHDDELVDEITEIWIRMRLLQVQARLEAWGEETSARLNYTSGDDRA